MKTARKPKIHRHNIPIRAEIHARLKQRCIRDGMSLSVLSERLLQLGEAAEKNFRDKVE